MANFYDVAPLDGYRHSEYALLMAMMQDGTREWLEEMGEVPTEAITWQPRPGEHSIGGIALHIANCEAGWIEVAALGRERGAAELQELMYEEIDVDEFKWPIPPAETWDWYLEKLQKVRARTLESVKEFGPPDSTYTSQRWGHTVTMRWIIQHVFHHEAYHGGQAVLLKRQWETR